jgi:tetratricopeptide (TPR) repeat protein
MALTELMCGYLYLVQGDGKNSLIHLENSVRYQQEIGAVIVMGITLSAMGLAHAFTDNLELALIETKKASRLAEEQGLALSAPQYPLYEGIIHLHSGNFEYARECCERALNLAKQTVEPINIATSMIVLGGAMGKANRAQFNQAVDTLLQGIEMCDELNMKPYSAQGFLYLGELYADAGQTDKALETLKKACATAIS